MSLGGISLISLNTELATESKRQGKFQEGTDVTKEHPFHFHIILTILTFVDS